MYVGISNIFIPFCKNPHIQDNNEEHIYTLDSGHSCLSLETLMSIDILNINYSLLVTEISNSYGEENGHHGHVANIPHLLDLYGNRVPGPGRPLDPGSQ